MYRAFSTLLLLPIAALTAGKASPVSFAKSIQPFFAGYCYRCHSSGLKSGALDLSSYTSPESVAGNRAQWEEVVRKLGFTDGHRPLSHHRNNPENMEKVTRVNCFHTGLFAYYLGRLKAIQDGDARCRTIP